MPAETADPPVTIKTEAIPNPVIPSDLDLSKSLFNQEMNKAKGEPPKAEETPEPVKDTPPVKVEKESTDKPAESSEAKSKIPEELLGVKEPEEPKVDDALAAIDAMVLPKNAKPEQVASFAKLKEQSRKVIEEKLARITELETKTSDATSKAEIEAAQARVKAAEEKAKELESTVERISFYESDKYKQFAADEEAQLTGAKAYFQVTEINPEIIEVAARSLGPNRIRILKEAGADSDIISAVAPYLASFDTIQRAKSTALENWKTTSARDAEQQKAQQEAAQVQRQAEEERVWAETVKETAQDIAAYRKFDGNMEWNERADRLDAEAHRIFNGDGIDLKSMGLTIRKGIAYDAEHEIRLDFAEQIRLLRAENAKLKAAKPDGGAGQSANGAPNKELTPQDRFNQELEKARSQ